MPEHIRAPLLRALRGLLVIEDGGGTHAERRADGSELRDRRPPLAALDLRDVRLLQPGGSRDVGLTQLPCDAEVL
jgi:hypothetical protein